MRKKETERKVKTKKSKTIWIVLGIIILIIGALSIANCVNTRASVDYSEFYSVVNIMTEDDHVASKEELNGAKATNVLALVDRHNASGVRIDNVVVDGYVIDFDVVLIKDGKEVSTAYTTVFGRNDTEISELQEKLSVSGAKFSYTDPNAGSIWSSLLPIFGTVIIAVVFFILYKTV